MITPGYSLSATERVLPRMALDFTTASLDSRVTVTRALNTATRVNSSGNIEIVNANLPRFDFSPASIGTCLGLLIEESRANLVLSSGNLSNATYWVAQRATAVGASGTAPDGTNSATLATEDTTASNNHLFSRQSVTAAAGATITKSVFLKNGLTNGRRYAILTMIGATNVEWVVAVVDLVAGVVTSTSNGTSGTYISSSITPWNNGWWRCTLTGSITGTNPNVRIQLSDTGTPASFGGFGIYAYNGNGVSNLYGWGMNVEVGAFATSYIPTTTTSLTRNADVVTMTGTNFSNWWQATTGSTVARARQLSVTGTRPWIQFDDATANNIIALRGNTTNPELYIKATTDQAQIDAGTIAANTDYGLTGAWNTNDCAAAINGANALTDTSATIPTVTQARLGSDGTNYLSGWLQSVRYWPQRITNAEVQAFSKL
jgi:hypothetical protein